MTKILIGKIFDDKHFFLMNAKSCFIYFHCLLLQRLHATCNF